MAALITGGGSGIGRALAILLASRGTPVILVGRREFALLETSAACSAALSSSLVRIVVADVASVDAPALIVAAVEGFSLRLSYVVHCAGQLGPIAPLSRVSRGDFEAVMATNVTGPVFLTAALLPLMASGARVLHISSGAAIKPIQGWGTYCISKAALNMAYRMLAVELKDANVAVGSVRPGVVETAMQEYIRSGDALVFPDHKRFIDLHKGMAVAVADANAVAVSRLPQPPPTAGLDTCENVAFFLAWLLNGADVSAQEFSASEWDSRDNVHHARWCTNGTMTPKGSL